MHTGAVLQAGIHDGGRGVDHAVDAAHDALDQLLQLLGAVEAFLEAGHFAVPFDEDFPAGVDHDLGNAGIVQQLRQHIQTAEAVEDGLPEIELVPERELRMGQQELIDAQTELRIGKLLGFREAREDFGFQFLL